MWVCTAFIIFNAVLALTLRTLLSWENRRLDEKYGEVGRSNANGVVAGEESGEKVDSSAGIGDENDGPRFRYIL